MSEFLGFKIVMFISFFEDDLVVQVIEVGVVSYVLKIVFVEELIYVFQGVY